MALQQDVVHVAGCLVHRVARRGLDHDLVDLVQAPGQHVLRSRERDEDLVVADLTEGAALGPEDAHDPKVQDPRALRAALTAAAERLAELDRLPDRVDITE